MCLVLNVPADHLKVYLYVDMVSACFSTLRMDTHASSLVPVCYDFGLIFRMISCHNIVLPKQLLRFNMLWF